MRKTTIMKLFCATFLVAALSGVPFVDFAKQEFHRVDLSLPVAGETFPIAGQEEPEVEANLILRAQKTCEVGELVRFDASESTVEGITWQILPKTKDFEVIEEGRRAFFSSRIPATQYLVILAGAKNGVPFLKHWTIRVKGEPVPPGPKSLDIKINDWLDLVPESETKQVKALAVAGVFRELATKKEVNVDGMLEATAVANVAVLGEDLEAWKPFLTELGDEIQTYVDSDQLQTRGQFEDVWLKVAGGLERAVQE